MQKTGKIKKKGIRQEENWTRFSFQLEGSDEWLSVITNKDTPEDFIKKLELLNEGQDVCFEVEEKTSGGKKFMNIKSVEVKSRAGSPAQAPAKNPDDRASIEKQVCLKAAVEFVSAIYGKDYQPGDIIPDEQIKDRIIYFADEFYKFLKTR